MNATTALVPRSPAELALAGPLGSFDAYVDAVSRIPVLSREDELALATRFTATDDLEAARQLVLSHLRFVVHIARGYARLRPAAGRPRPGRQHRPDEGREALRPGRGRAPGVVRRALDPRRDPRIRAAQLAPGEGRHDQGAAQAVLQPAQEQANLGWLSRRGDAGRGARPGRDDREVTEMERRLSSRDLSFDPAPDADEEEDVAIRPRPTCRRRMPTRRSRSSATSGTTTSATGGASHGAARCAQPGDPARALDGRAKATLHDLADQYGVSAERIRQIEANAIKKLQKLVVGVKT